MENKAQTSELLKAMQKMDASEAKVDANLKEIKEDIKTNQAKMEARIEANNWKFEVLRDTLVSWMDAHHAKTDVNHEEMMAKLDAHHEWMRASVNAWRKETTACQEVTEAYPEKMEANPEDMESVAECWVVPKEHATVNPVRGLRKWHRGRNLAAERRQKSIEWTQGNCGSWKKLAAAHRGMTHLTGVAPHKGHVFRKNQTRDKVG
jgi:hypothetical protein